MKLRVKYLDGAKNMEKIPKGNWIDVYAYEDVFVPVGQRKMINLGFALELPQGWEGHLSPRSSTFKTWGIIQTNSVGVVDDTYIGDNDIWHMPVYCLQGKDLQTPEEEILKNLGASTIEDVVLLRDDEYIKDYKYNTENGCRLFATKKGTWIRKGDKIGQFRIMEVMPKIEFEEVESFGNADRGGFGTTGQK